LNRHSAGGAGTSGADGAAGGKGFGTALVIEDDTNIAELVELYLQKEGFGVLRASDGTRGLELAALEQPRVVLLDIGLSGPLDGLEVCRTLRARSQVPIVFLSARGDELDRVLGLELGGDDYITKPFSPRELVARIRAVLRRTDHAAGGGTEAGAAIVVGEVKIDPARREVVSGGELVELTAREFELLWHLGRNKGLVLSRQQLLDGAWGPGWYGDPRTVDVHVAQVRKKLPSLPLTTVRGVGYRLG
jgi:DNA-binding response OmpR family regulator